LLHLRQTLIEHYTSEPHKRHSNLFVTVLVPLSESALFLKAYAKTHITQRAVYQKSLARSSNPGVRQQLHLHLHPTAVRLNVLGHQEMLL